MTKTTSPSSHAECHEIRGPKPPGTLWATLGLLRDYFTFTMEDLHLHLVIKIRNLRYKARTLNPLNAELNSICHLVVLLGGSTIVVVSRLRVNVV